MIAALWSNSNYDDDKGTRKNAIEELEENFTEAINMILGVTREEEIAEDNPFFAPAFKGMQDVKPPEVTDIERQFINIDQ